MPRRRKRERAVEPPPERVPTYPAPGTDPIAHYRRLCEYINQVRDWEKRTGLRLADNGEVISAAEYRRRCQQRWRRGATN